MTTIAWDGETLASDSRASDDAIEQHSCRKLFRVGETLIGISGDLEEAYEFVAWVRRGEVVDEKPRGFKDLSAIVIRPNGRAFEYGVRCMPVPSARLTAAGTGRCFALGAMLAGASAVEAVAIAKRLDPNSGGRTQTMRLRGR